MDFDNLVFGLVLLIIAALYASVGQAGGTGYVAALGLAGFEPNTIKPTVLALNILVAAIGTIRFGRAGLLHWRACFPFAALGIPLSVLGGALHLPAPLYRPVVGVLMLAAAVQLVLKKPGGHVRQHAPLIPALLVGGLIGLISGCTGVGGGIFLAPVVLAFGWSASVVEAAALSAFYNLANSGAALLGAWTSTRYIPGSLPWWLLAVGIGGLVGSSLSLRRLPARTLRYLLAAILVASSLRFLGGR